LVALIQSLCAGYLLAQLVILIVIRVVFGLDYFEVVFPETKGHILWATVWVLPILYRYLFGVDFLRRE
jgi:hypothetical protein